MFPKAVLSNGAIVANFGSPHPFRFDDDTMLDAANEELVEATKYDRKMIEKEGIKGTKDVEMRTVATVRIFELLQEAEDDDSIDILIVPFPLLLAIKEAGMQNNFKKPRTIVLADRTTKICHHDKFCI